MEFTLSSPSSPSYRFANFFATGTLVFLAIVLVSVFYLYVIDSNPPVVVTSSQMHPKTAVPGEIVYMRNDYCKYTPVSSSLSAFWRRDDGLIWGLAQQQLAVSKVGCYTIEVPLTIPENIPDGRWQRVNIAEYKVNLIATRQVGWESDFIKIEAP